MKSPRVEPFLDFFNFEDELLPEQRASMVAVRDFVKREIEPGITDAYRKEELPVDLMGKLGKQGLLGSFMTGYGLPGTDALTYGLALRELERCDSGVRSAASVQGALAMYAIFAFGSEEQKQRWLPGLGRGEAIGSFALTENEGGSDPGAMKTRLIDSGDHFLLHGSKTWITNGHMADINVVWARCGDKVVGVLVPKGAPDFTAKKMRNKLSLRASETSELFFENVKIAKNAVLEKTQGLKSALDCLNQARFGIAWGAVGAAEFCFAESLKFVRERIVFGKALASFQLVQAKLARMAAEITQAQLLALQLAKLKARGDLHFAQVSLAKQANVEMALRTARTARDLLGANGIMDEYGTMRHLCNLETVYTYEGTNDIHLLVVAKELTGIAAFN